MKPELQAEHVLAVLAAAEKLADTLADIDGELWGHFTCREIGIVEAFLRRISNDTVADNIIEAHGAYDDDSDDAHHDIYLRLRKPTR